MVDLLQDTVYVIGILDRPVGDKVQFRCFSYVHGSGDRRSQITCRILESLTALFSPVKSVYGADQDSRMRQIGGDFYPHD